tara:strand:+ start:15816 stop:16253 length:438 start_codon:yes stop_codon:yes gene_type:complete
MARSNFKFYENEYPYFLTCTVVDGIDLFADPRISHIILNAFVHIQTKMQVKIYGFVIMHNHIPFIAESNNLSEDIRRFKSFTAREIIRYLESTNRSVFLKRLKRGKINHKKKSTYQVWQEGSYPRQVNNLRKMEAFIEYIHFNSG